MYNLLLQNEASLQEKMKIVYKITDPEKKRTNGEVPSVDFLQWYSLNVHMR